MTIKMVNLTPHEVNLVNENVTLNIPTSGIIARCEETSKPYSWINGIEVVTKTFGNVSGLPAKEKNTIYIVSSLVAQAVEERDDVYTVGNPIRNDKGQIIGAQCLCRV